LRRRRRSGFGEFDAPDVFIGFKAQYADMIGFGGANLADPDDTEAGFAPAAADFDGLWPGEVRKPTPSRRAPSWLRSTV